MDDTVNVSSVSVAYYDYCYNHVENLQLEFFSIKGVVRLRISNVPFEELSYSINTSDVTGTLNSTVTVTSVSAKTVHPYKYCRKVE